MKKEVLNLFFSALALLPASASAQALKTFSIDTLKETGRVFTAPIHLSYSGAELAGAILAAELLIYSQDGQIRHLASKNRSSLADNIFNSLEKFGRGSYEIAFLFAYGAIGKVIKNDYMQDTAVLAMESFIAANALGTFIKYSAGRSRPYAGDGKGKFSPFNMKTSGTSLPSGHTVSAFSVASVFASRTDSTWIKILAYTMASGVAAQRIYSDKHWASDVIAGAFIGTMVGRDLTNRYNKSSSLSLLPIPGGLSLAYRF
jgi:membrane-associated phospholipid phosphatase